MLEETHPIIFAGHIEHGVMAQAMKHVYPGVEVTSAGFVDDLKVNAAFGRSISLHMNANDQDTSIINRLGRNY